VYIGGTVGQAEFKDGCQAWQAATRGHRVEDSRRYQFNRYFAAELGYHDSASVRAAGATKGTAWELVGIGSYPIANQFSVYGKLGAYAASSRRRTRRRRTPISLRRRPAVRLHQAVGVRGECSAIARWAAAPWSKPMSMC